MGVSETLKNRGNLILAGVGIVSAGLFVHGGIDIWNIRNYSTNLVAQRYPDLTDASISNAWRVIISVRDQSNELFQRQGDTALISGRGSIEAYQQTASSPDLKEAYKLLMKQREESAYMTKIEDSMKPDLLKFGEPLLGLIGFMGIGLGVTFREFNKNWVSESK